MTLAAHWAPSSDYLCLFSGSFKTLTCLCSCRVSAVYADFTLALTEPNFHSAFVSYFKPRPAPSSCEWTFTDMSQKVAFDRKLTRISLLIDAIYDVLTFFLPSQSFSTLFAILLCLTSFTSGGNPAMHLPCTPAALVLRQQGRSDEIGKLFGALAVLPAVAHIISVPLCVYHLVFPMSLFCSSFASLAR